MKQKLIACKNCEKDYEEGFQFCPYCGQKKMMNSRLVFYFIIP